MTADGSVYLGTFQLHPTPDARGEFTIDISSASLALDAERRSIPVTVDPLRIFVNR